MLFKLSVMDIQPENGWFTTAVRPQRDFELRKVLFGATISQILYARHSFPPHCFQVIPIDNFTSRSFTDMVTGGSPLQVYEKELLRDEGFSVFLRHGADYGVSRFLGILIDDIFPLLESEQLVSFRIIYLKEKTWVQDSLSEHYTINLKYESDGRCVIDVWRAGIGKISTSTGNSELWILGDYLSRLPSWKDNKSWTLAFHVKERPDDPLIGVWKFGQTEFNDANLILQQQSEYTYDRIIKFDIIPPSFAIPERPAIQEHVISKLPDPVDETVLQPEGELQHHMAADSIPIPQPQAMQQSEADIELRPLFGCENEPNFANASMPESECEVPAEPDPHPEVEHPLKHECELQQQLQPKRQKRKPSKRTAEIYKKRAKRNQSSKLAQKTQRSQSLRSAKQPASMQRTSAEPAAPKKQTQNRGSRIGAPKRKPKKPVQLDDMLSSLPATQVIGDSQSLGLLTQTLSQNQSQPMLKKPRKRLTNTICSPTPETFPLLDGVQLSPEGMILEERNILPQSQLESQESMFGQIQDDVSEMCLNPRCIPASQLFRPDSLLESQARQQDNLIGIALSDDDERIIETTSEAEEEENSVTEAHKEFRFSPQTVERRKMMFYEIPSSED